MDPLDPISVALGTLPLNPLSLLETAINSLPVDVQDLAHQQLEPIVGMIQPTPQQQFIRDIFASLFPSSV